MSFDSNFLTLMPSTAKVQELASLSTDGYGVPVYGSTLTFRCHVMQKPTMVKTIDGTEELAHTVVWMNSTSTFSPYAKITVNGSTVGPVLAVQHHYDEDGLHHTKVAFG